MDKTKEIESSIADQAIEKGVNYLLSKNLNGRWRGFPTLAGESDIWVTGFVLSHINKFIPQPDIINAAQNFLLQSRHSSGGWSYSTLVPPDADSTAWCLIVLQSINVATESVMKEAITFMWSHFTGNGVSTYRNESGIREFISAPSEYPISGWTSAHPDVSVAALLTDFQNEKAPGIISWLADQQTKEGYINSYWWRSPYYTITLLLRVLARYNKRLPDEWAGKIADSLVSNQLASGGFSIDSSGSLDAFTTALALESFAHLSYLGLKEQRHLCAKALLDSQQEDGNWAGDFILRIPVPHIVNPEDVPSWNSAVGGGNSLIADKDGLFATTMACHALDCWRQNEQ